MKKNGLLDDEEAMYRRLEPMGRRTYGDGPRSGDTAVGPPKVSGKRLFVELVPYVVRGAKLRSRGGNNRGGFARRGFGGRRKSGGRFEPIVVAFVSKRDQICRVGFERGRRDAPPRRRRRRRSSAGRRFSSPAVPRR